VFIAFSSVAVSQILKFPFRIAVEEKRRLTLNRWITTVIIVTLLPSVYFGYGLVQKEQFVENASRYVNNVNVFEGNFLLQDNVDVDTRMVTLTYGGSTLSPDQEERIREKAADFGLEDVEVVIKQGIAFDEISERFDEAESLRAEVQRLTQLLRANEMHEDSMNMMGMQLLEEIQPLFPVIRSCAYAQTPVHSDTSVAKGLSAIVLFGIHEDTTLMLDREGIHKWLVARLNTKDVRIYYDH
jgi:hypothetical protein